jgi:hypothetical protein
VHVLTLAESGAIAEIACFADPELTDRFNLPPSLGGCRDASQGGRTSHQ